MNKVWLEHHKSLWMETSGHTHYAPLNKALQVDVAIIGGGISGLSAAYMLQSAGKSVALVEKDEIAMGESGYTTAHLSVALDTRYYKLISKFGEEKTFNVLQSTHEAIDFIEKTSLLLARDTKFKRVPAYLYAENFVGIEDVEKEAIATLDLGLKTTLLRNMKIKSALTDLPFPVEAVLRFDNQAQFHPRLYMLAMADAFVKAGGKIFEHTPIQEIHDGSPCMIASNRGSIKADHVLVLTNSPISTRVAIHTKIASYRTYSIAFKGKALDGLYWDTLDPYHYIRTEKIDGKNYVIIGGEDHKTGQVTDTAHCFDKLEGYARKKFNLIGDVDYRWSGQIIEPVDGLPYIGVSPGSHNIYLATGFSGNGMTFGTLSAMILKDMVLGIESPWADIYDPSRISPLAGAKEFLKENSNASLYMIRDWMHTDNDLDTDSLPEGEGAIFERNGKKIAAYKDENGKMHFHSAICPHLGACVHWNNAESSWDCPCHGSRFDAKGKVLNGPAKTNLEKIELPGGEEEYVQDMPFDPLLQPPFPL